MRLRFYLGHFILAGVLVLWHGSHRAVWAVDQTLPGYVTTVADDTLYIEVVGDHHLGPGDTGVIKFKGREVAYVRVTEASARYLNLQIISQASGVELATGDSIVFESRIEEDIKARELDHVVLGGLLDKESTPAKSLGSMLFHESPPSPSAPPPAPAVVAESTGTAKASTLKSASPDADFVPLLSPVAVPVAAKSANSRVANIFHGRVRARELYQSIPSLGVYGSQSRLDSEGSIERLYASPWSLAWNGNVTYRDGNDFPSATDYRRPKAHIYSAVLSRKMIDGGAWSMGRVLPTALPGVGFLDGSQLEHVVSSSWRLGGLAAFRPDRLDLSMTSKEPLAAAYATTEQGTHGALYYTGTLGVMQSLYRGNIDECALLYDHRADLGPKLNLFATSQVDFNAGAARAHSGARMTRLDAYGNSPVLPYLSFRAGVSHYERPDTAAERDLTGGSPTAFDNGYWRYFVGSNQRLPWQLMTDEELSYLDSGSQQTDELWRVSISRMGLLFLPQAQVTLAMYNVTSLQGTGLAFQGTASTPLWSNAVSLSLASSAQYISTDTSPKRYDVNDASVRLTWRITRAWNVDAGFTQTYQGGVTSTIADGALSYRW